MIEYLTLGTGGLPMPDELLNKLGMAGWQLIQITRDTAYFCRPRVAEPIKEPIVKTSRKKVVV